MNNKGFAITTVLYGIMILFCMLLVSMLGILSSYQNNLKKLIDENNGARAIIHNDSINKNTFTPSSNQSKYIGNGIYNFKNRTGETGRWDSYCLQPSLFTDNQKYQLSYSIQKTAGTLKNIGGHSPATRNLLFYLDNELQECSNLCNRNAYHAVAGTTNLANDNDIHDVIVEFIYDSSAAGSDSKIICIQPNRGLTDDISVNIFNLKLVKLSN